jgi:uncharacterized membrane protein
MDDAPAIVLLVGLAAAVLVVAPIFAFLAWIRVRDLERKVTALARRLDGQAVTPPHAAEAPVASAPSVPVTTPVVGIDTAVPIAAASPHPVEAASGPAERAHRGTDWEGAIAGRWLQRVGLLAVAIGVAFFLKTAIDNDWVGPLGQVALGIVLGAALVAFAAWLLPRGYRYFSEGLTGLGAAVLYLSLWAAGSYYHLVSPTVAFVAMVIVTAAMVVIALGRNSQRIALLAMIGGFLTPILVSTGQDAEVSLFVYLVLQDAALLALVWRRDWRYLEIPAFVFTQMYFWSWYDRFYVADALVPTAIFASLFFVLFATLPVLRSRRHGAFRVEHGIVLVVNVWSLLWALRIMLWPEQAWLLTAATLGLAAFHLAAARAVPRDESGQALPRLFLGGLALTLITLAIPMRLSGRWTSMGWSVEAAVLVWSGFRLRVPALRAAALILFVIVAVRILSGPLPADRFILNPRFMVSMVAAACAVVSLALARRHADQVTAGERLPFGLLAVGVNALVILTFTQEIDLAFAEPAQGFSLIASDTMLARGLTVSLLWTVCASMLLIAGVRLASPLLRWQGLALFGLTTLKVFLADLADLSGFYRVMSAMALGVVLLIVSFSYQRRLAASREAKHS